MDLYDYLKMDHKNVATLFDLFKTAQTKKNKFEIFEMIKKELLLHATSEANTFYKALEAHQKSSDEALHGEQEHLEIFRQLEKISNLKTINPTFEKEMLQLKTLVDHHVSEEEGKIFKVAKKVLNDKEAWIIKIKMHDEKEKLSHATYIDMRETIPEL